jgi:hypothetical protein
LSPPKSLAELLEREGVASRWFTLPAEEFKDWWIGVSWKEAIDRFWQIEAEYRAIAAEWSAINEGTPTVATELQEEIWGSRLSHFTRHFGAVSAAPGINETEEEFYERQAQRTFRQFEQKDFTDFGQDENAEPLVAKQVA